MITFVVLVAHVLYKCAGIKPVNSSSSVFILFYIFPEIFYIFTNYFRLTARFFSRERDRIRTWHHCLSIPAHCPWAMLHLKTAIFRIFLPLQPARRWISSWPSPGAAWGQPSVCPCTHCCYCWCCWRCCWWCCWWAPASPPAPDPAAPCLTL